MFQGVENDIEHGVITVANTLGIISFHDQTLRVAKIPLAVLHQEGDVPFMHLLAVLRV